MLDQSPSSEQVMFPLAALEEYPSVQFTLKKSPLLPPAAGLILAEFVIV